MTVRHLADAIRGQNWLTVLIELTVVVVGIFLGLQIDDWNEQRKEYSLERGYIERLEADVDANIEVYRVAVRRLDCSGWSGTRNRSIGSCKSTDIRRYRGVYFLATCFAGRRFQ